MPRAGQCAACSHRNLARAEEMRAVGMSSMAIARETGISEPSWRRHVKKGCGAKPPAVPPAALALPPAELPAGHPVAPLLQQLAEIHGPALESYRLAVLGGNVNQQILLLPQLRNNLKAQESMLAKVEQPKDETERLLGHPDFAETALCLARVLDPYPEARAAYVAELERLCGK